MNAVLRGLLALSVLILATACGGDSGDGAPPDASLGHDATPDATPPDATPEVCLCDQNLALSDYCVAQCATSFETLFAHSQLPSFYLTIPDDNGAPGQSSWELLASCTREEHQQVDRPAHCDYQIGSFHAEYDPFPDDGNLEVVTTPEIPVGIRRKGRATWRDLDDKPSLKVKFTEFDSERFLGLTRLTLNNMVQDPSMMRERVAYHVYRALDVTAPLANHARVYVRRNDAEDYQYYGLYANVQTLDKRFLEYNFGRVDGELGNLFDTYNDVFFTDLDRANARQQAGPAPGAQEARFELETNDTVPDISDLTAAIDAVYTVDPLADNSQFVEDIEAILDVDAFLRTFAAMAIITDWDGFAGARNNYKLYHDLVRDRFVLFPWGTDQTFGWQDSVYYPNWDYAFDHTDSRREPSLASKRCAADPTDCQARYLALADDAVTSFGLLDLSGLTQEIEAQTEFAALADTRKPYSDLEYYRGILYLRHYLENRASCARGQLDGQPCAPLTCPPGSSGNCSP